MRSYQPSAVDDGRRGGKHSYGRHRDRLTEAYPRKIDAFHALLRNEYTRSFPRYIHTRLGTQSERVQIIVKEFRPHGERAVHEHAVAALLHPFGKRDRAVPLRLPAPDLLSVHHPRAGAVIPVRHTHLAGVERGGCGQYLEGRSRLVHRGNHRAFRRAEQSFQVVARHVVEVEGRIFGEREYLSRFVIHHHARSRFRLKPRLRGAQRTLRYTLYRRVESGHDIHALHRGNIITPSAFDLPAHEVGVREYHAVRTRKVFVVIRFQPGLTLSVETRKSESLSHEIPERVIPEVVLAVIYPGKSRFHQRVELFLVRAARYGDLGSVHGNFRENIVVFVPEHLRKQFRHVLLASRGIGTYIYVVSGRGIRKHGTVAVEDPSPRRFRGHVAHPLRDSLCLQIAALDHHHGEHLPQHRGKGKSRKQ